MLEIGRLQVIQTPNHMNASGLTRRQYFGSGSQLAQQPYEPSFSSSLHFRSSCYGLPNCIWVWPGECLREDIVLNTRHQALGQQHHPSTLSFDICFA